MKKSGKKSNFSTLILILILIFGLSLLLYPTISDYWNSFTQSKAVANYSESVAQIDEAEYDKIWNSAIAYNKKLSSIPMGLSLSDEMKKEYYKQLSVDDSGIMGIVEIPLINVSLPVYHGTNEDVLQVAIGHIEWTSLPTGGIGTHCVVSGHRGLPSAKLFTHLDQLSVGDVFMLRILNEVLTYEIDQILIVEPNITENLKIDKTKDYCTLTTCTPYGINSHRLLLRGHRIENIEEAKTVRITSDAVRIEPLWVAPVLALPILIVLLFVMLFPKKRSKKETEGEIDEDL